MFFSDLTSALGYDTAALYRQDDGRDLVAPEDRHLIRAAREAGVKGTFFFRISPEGKSYRPAVHVATANSAEEARELHKRLWNQGVNPFLIVLLPGEVRIYTGFSYHPSNDRGLVNTIPFPQDSLTDLATLLGAFNSDAINGGQIWRQQSKHLRSRGRVDTTLLSGLKTLSEILQERHSVSLRSSHALIGRFVYLHYLRAKGILSDQWMEREAQVTPEAVFSGEATLEAFRRLSHAVEATFNGRIFPIPWGGRNPPRATAIKEIARVFAGEDPSSGQMALPFTAYDFSWIPIELLSSIYEQFLHAEDPDGSDHDGAHYTPEPLAEYVISEVQAARPLRSDIRVLDACCGSGVFLVVAFRRIVEYHCATRKCSSLPPQELKNLLTRSIYGVERNETACEITAFSLILAMLTYVQPPELHRLKSSFKFPNLKWKNLFPEDFFAPDGRFWLRQDPQTQRLLRFDWIVGNPPWVELAVSDPKAGPMLKWISNNKEKFGLARARTGEAFAWKVREKLTTNGVAGLVLGAKTLTNDHLKMWRQKFFSANTIHRVTNFANLAYAIFPKVKEPAATLTFSVAPEGKVTRTTRHVGPFVANQVAISTTRKAWVVALTESEIKAIPTEELIRGEGSTWKLALWGNHRDPRELARLKGVLPLSMDSLVEKRGWHLALGLQLRSGPGKRWRDENGELKQENEYVKELEGLPLLDHKALVRAGSCLEFRNRWQIENKKGCFVRGGRKSGVGLIGAPHVFLWNDFAAFSANDFIVEHDKVALSGPAQDADWLRAISLIWTSSVTQYFLFFELNAAWGIGRSQIDLGDAQRVRLPDLNEAVAKRLADLHRELSAQLSKGNLFENAFRRELDKQVAKQLKIPKSLMETATDFAINRLALNQGKAPPSNLLPPGRNDLNRYAVALRDELDVFVGGKAHHRVMVLYGQAGACASIEITGESKPIAPLVRAAEGKDIKSLRVLLEAAEQKFSQWVYVKRSVRIMDGRIIHLIKPPRRMEWTAARALLDSDDLIAEIANTRR